jgi:hypothetical protein
MALFVVYINTDVTECNALSSVPSVCSDKKDDQDQWGMQSRKQRIWTQMHLIGVSLSFSFHEHIPVLSKGCLKYISCLSK